ALDHSGWNAFSPLAYPWGFPLLLAPLVGAWTFDYDSLKVVGVVAMGVFVVGFNRVITPRVGYWPGLALTGIFVVSRPFLRSTETIQSDLPYAAFSMLGLWAVDVAHRRGGWRERHPVASIGLGVLVAWVFTVRREGLALVVAITACQA